jgi:hypothetical protein
LGLGFTTPRHLMAASTSGNSSVFFTFSVGGRLGTFK